MEFLISIIVSLMANKKETINVKVLNVLHGITIDTVIYHISQIIWIYLEFISSKNNYVVLTVVSEVLNLGRMYPTILMLKIIVDMHREYMKMCL